MVGGLVGNNQRQWCLWWEYRGGLSIAAAAGRLAVWWGLLRKMEDIDESWFAGEVKADRME